MFQFGLFSTFIPYLLFAIAYLGFIGSSALQKNQYVDYNGLPSQYEISKTNIYHEISFQYSVDKNKPSFLNFYFAYLLDNVSNTEISHTQNKITQTDKFYPLNKFIKIYFFTRPPPIV